MSFNGVIWRNNQVPVYIYVFKIRIILILDRAILLVWSLFRY